MPIDYPTGAAWPPQDYECMRSAELYTEYHAWYSGEPVELFRYYSRQINAQYPAIRPSQLRGGAVGFLARMFWGRPLTPGQSTTHFHIPAASDLAQLSSDLLFAEPPAFTVPDQDSRHTASDGAVVNANPAQEALEMILDQGGAYAVLSEAAELAAAYGGVFIRATSNVDLIDVPVLDAIPPDCALPDWGPAGMLTGVTFWRVVGAHGPGDSTRLRHLERHEIDPASKTCAIYHALYRGSIDRLGQLVPLQDGDAECQRLAQLVGPSGEIDVGTTKLDVVYMPNLRPNRDIRGTYLGRSDFSGLAPTFDALDETWSSLMRDIRLAKARIIVPAAYLRSLGAGRGATFDAEQEIFVGVSTEGPDKPLQMSAEQFDIRVDQHLATAQGLWATITRAAGLSADAFGETQDGAPMTARQVGTKKERTASTRGKKINYATRPLRSISFVLLELHALNGDTSITPSPVDIEWPDASAPDPMALAQTLQYLEAAKAVSTRQKVLMLHPDWDDTDVDEEVQLIEDENAPPPMPDPGTFDGGGQDPQPVDKSVDQPPPAPGAPSAGG